MSRSSKIKRLRADVDRLLRPIVKAIDELVLAAGATTITGPESRDALIARRALAAYLAWAEKESRNAGRETTDHTSKGRESDGGAGDSFSSAESSGKSTSSNSTECADAVLDVASKSATPESAHHLSVAHNLMNAPPLERSNAFLRLRAYLIRNPPWKTRTVLAMCSQCAIGIAEPSTLVNSEISKACDVCGRSVDARRYLMDIR